MPKVISRILFIQSLLLVLNSIDNISVLADTTNDKIKLNAQTSNSDNKTEDKTSQAGNIIPDRIISLQSAFKKASENNKEIDIAKYDIAIAKAQIKIAKAVANPRFSLQYGFGPAFTIILAGNPQQFGLQFDLQLAGKRTKNINYANANYKLTYLQLEALLFDIHNRTRRAYAELVAAEAYEDLIEAQRKTALDLENIAQKRYDAIAFKSQVRNFLSFWYQFYLVL